ncbi:hypothetical protein DsansV1_C04g0036721 [Dioscorea sansibarensis]
MLLLRMMSLIKVVYVRLFSTNYGFSLCLHVDVIVKLLQLNCSDCWCFQGDFSWFVGIRGICVPLCDSQIEVWLVFVCSRPHCFYCRHSSVSLLVYVPCKDLLHKVV